MKTNTLLIILLSLLDCFWSLSVPSVHLLSCMRRYGITIRELKSVCDDKGAGGNCCHWFYSEESFSGRSLKAPLTTPFDTDVFPAFKKMFSPPKMMSAVISPDENGNMFVNMESRLNFGDKNLAKPELKRGKVSDGDSSSKEPKLRKGQVFDGESLMDKGGFHKGKVLEGGLLQSQTQVKKSVLRDNKPTLAAPEFKDLKKNLKKETKNSMKTHIFSNTQENQNLPNNNEESTTKKVTFKGGQRRGIVVPKTKHDFKHKKPSLIRTQSVGSGYSREVCLELKVPCRFVSDHPCCSFAMPIDLVARARSMDGSADLIYRPISPASSKPQGRSLNGFRSGRKIQYEFATSSSKVKTPKYIFKGFGLDITSNLIGNCWRVMDNVNCSKSKSHPCCLITSQPSGPPTLDRVSRWLVNTY